MIRDTAVTDIHCDLGIDDIATVSNTKQDSTITSTPQQSQLETRLKRRRNPSTSFVLVRKKSASRVYNIRTKMIHVAVCNLITILSKCKNKLIKYS